MGCKAQAGNCNVPAPGRVRLARMLVNVGTALAALAILGALLWAMHEDALYAQRRERMEREGGAPQPTAEQRRHIAAQFVCGHGVAYQWVDERTVECLREASVASNGR